MSEIFNKKYYKIYDLTTELVAQLILSIFNQMDITPLLSNQFLCAKDIIEKFNFNEQSILPLKWMLLFLSNKNYLSLEKRESDYYFRLISPTRYRNPDEIASEILAIDYKIAPSNNLLKSVREDYPDFFLGRKSGVEILFSSDKANLWKDYFSNEHNGYAVHNHFGAQGVIKWFPKTQGTIILEVGGGIGGSTVALLELFKKESLLTKVKEYIFSDISPIFLRLGNQLIMEKLPEFERVALKKLDFNKPLTEQKINPESIDIVYGVNALHVANDLFFTFKEMKNILKKGGVLIISECVRDSVNSTPQPEFIFNLLDNYRNVKIDLNGRKTIGFLTPDNWKQLFEKAGFENVETLLNSNFDNNIEYPAIAMVIKGQKV